MASIWSGDTGHIGIQGGVEGRNGPHTVPKTKLYFVIGQRHYEVTWEIGRAKPELSVERRLSELQVEDMNYEDIFLFFLPYGSLYRKQRTRPFEGRLSLPLAL